MLDEFNKLGFHTIHNFFDVDLINKIIKETNPLFEHIDPDSNMTLGDLKKQIMDFEYEEEDDPEKVSQFYGYDDEDMDETKIINGVTNAGNA